MNSVLEWFRAPGALRAVEFSASTQGSPQTNDKKQPEVEAANVEMYKPIVKPKLLDRLLDRAVEKSGSDIVYFSFLIALLVWAFLGIKFGQSSTWIILISDAQAIINMVFDAFLMRQQFNNHADMLMVAASLRSRAVSHKRMLRQLVAQQVYEKMGAARVQELRKRTQAVDLPAEDLLTRIPTAVAAILGHFVTVCVFWVCIAIWLGFGPSCGWSNQWQLYINSATSALMVFMLAFIANVRERHARYSKHCLREIWNIDAKLELELRRVTGDIVQNPSITIPARKRSGVQRAIDYYADLVGTLAGIAILILVLVIWGACGPALHFNSNWWLLIGTYAGLVGLHDGFVLRNICDVLEAHEDDQFAKVEFDDQDALAEILMVEPIPQPYMTESFMARISIRMGMICSSQWTVVSGVVFIIGLLIGATVMEWSVTGQLLCNIPPSIIESFFTMILITGHNIMEKKRRTTLSNVHERRLLLLAYIQRQKETESKQELL